MDCKKFAEIASGISLIVDCSEVITGLLRFTTIFKYPDGSNVDLFLKQHTDTFIDTYTLTDLGETTGYLLEMNIRPWKTQKRKKLIAEICSALDVAQDGGELKISLTAYETNQLGDAFLRLAQACIRVSDVSLTQTLRAVSLFKEDVEEFLESTGYRYQTDQVIPGKFGQEVRVDFRVEGPRQVSLLQAMTAANPVVARHVADDVFTRWYDIPHVRTTAQIVTVLDASVQTFSEPDLRRLEELSLLVAFPDQQAQLLEVLAA